jgi:hypothetical protein
MLWFFKAVYYFIVTKLDKEKNQCIRGKTGAQNIVKEIKPYQKQWLQHVQRMDTNRIPKTSTAVQTERKKEHRVTEEEMEGPTSSGGLRNRITRLNFHEHDDDDDDDDIILFCLSYVFRYVCDIIRELFRAC